MAVGDERPRADGRRRRRFVSSRRRWRTDRTASALRHACSGASGHGFWRYWLRKRTWCSTAGTPLPACAAARGTLSPTAGTTVSYRVSGEYLSPSTQRSFRRRRLARPRQRQARTRPRSLRIACRLCWSAARLRGQLQFSLALWQARRVSEGQRSLVELRLAHGSDPDAERVGER